VLARSGKSTETEDDPVVEVEDLIAHRLGTTPRTVTSKDAFPARAPAFETADAISATVQNNLMLNRVFTVIPPLMIC
jgi:hypothetical protein